MSNEQDEKYGEAGHEPAKKAPRGLLILMAAPLLLIAIPIMLLVFVPSKTPTGLDTSQSAGVTTQSPGTAETPATAENPFPDAPVPESPIVWQTSFKSGLELAKQEDKLAMIDFYTDWCGPCKAMDAYTWTHESVIEEAKNVVPIKVRADAPENVLISQLYNITGFPCIVWMDASGKEKFRITGALGPEDMLAEMKKQR